MAGTAGANIFLITEAYMKKHPKRRVPGIPVKASLHMKPKEAQSDPWKRQHTK